MSKSVCIARICVRSDYTTEKPQRSAFSKMTWIFLLEIEALLIVYTSIGQTLVSIHGLV